MSLDPLLLDVLACPVDKGPLLWFEDEDVLYNPRLHKSYAVVDGVPVLLVDEAVDRRRRRARAADGQGRERRGAGHRAGVWVSERAHLDTLGMWEAAAALPEQLSGALADGGRRVRRVAAARRRDRGPRRRRVRPGHRRDGLRGGGRPDGAPTWRCPSGWATGPRSRPSSTPTRWSSPCRPRASTAETLGRRRGGGRTRGARWWPSAVSRRSAGPPGRRRRAAVVPGVAGAALAAPRRAGGDHRAPAGRAGPGRAAAGLRRGGRRGRGGAGPPARRPAGAGRRRRRSWRADSAAPSRSSTAPTGVAAVAARWWKAQVNLNAKAPAFAATLPELTHDELAGWGQGGDVTRQTMSLVLLRHAGEGPRAAGAVRRGAGGHRRGHGRRLRGAGRGRRRPVAASSTWRCWASSSRCTWPPARAWTRARCPRSTRRRPARPTLEPAVAPPRRSPALSSGARRSWPCPGRRRRTSTRGRTSCRCPRAR